MMLSVLLKHIRPKFDHIHLKTCRGLETGDKSNLVRSHVDSWEFKTNSKPQLSAEDIGRFDAVIFTPGAGIQLDDDPRSDAIMQDLKFCQANKIPVAFPSNSVQPKFYDDLADVFVVAREAASYRGLKGPKHLSGDLAFLLDLPKYTQKDQALICFRFNRFDKFQRKGSKVFCSDSRSKDKYVFTMPDNPIVTSSDYRRDKPKKLAKTLGADYKIVDELDDLIQLIGESKSIITDRYHPAIIAHRYGLDVEFIPRPVNRDAGLLEYLNQKNGLKGKLEGISEVLDPNQQSNDIQQATLDGIDKLIQHLI